MTSVKLIAGLVSLSLILLLLASGPARAFIFNLAINNTSPLLGETIQLQVSAEVEPSEIVDIQTLTLNIDGPESITCEFYPNGTMISSCPGVEITTLNVPTYQYGYGFLPGFLKYEIDLDTTVLQNGDYTAQLIAHTPSGDLETSEQDFMVVQLSTPVDRCSIRAENGEVQIDGEVFDGRNKVSLFASGENSRNSKGTFTSQHGRDRISYKFTVDDARRTTGDVVYFEVHGELLVNRELSQETSTIVYNSRTSELYIRGDIFNASGMSVNFARC